MRKLTRYLYGTTYIITAIMSVIAFVIAYVLTVPPSENAGGNGNFGLIGLALLYPFIIIFVAMSIYYVDKYMCLTLQLKTIWMTTLISLGVLLLIVSVTIMRALKLKETLAEVNPVYKGATEIPLFTVHSNEIFFNFFTFISLLLVSICIGGLLAYNKKKSIVKQYNKPV